MKYLHYILVPILVIIGCGNTFSIFPIEYENTYDEVIQVEGLEVLQTTTERNCKCTEQGRVRHLRVKLNNFEYQLYFVTEVENDKSCNDVLKKIVN